MPRPNKPWPRKDRPGWYANVNGKQQRLIGATDRASAWKVLHRLLAQDRPAQRNDLTLTEAADLWLDHIKATCKPETHKQHSGLISTVCREFGELRIGELKVPAVQRWLASKTNENATRQDDPPKVSTATKRAYIVRLRAAIRWAIDEGHYVGADPLAKLPLPPKTRRTKVVTAEERERVIAMADPDLRDLLTAGAMTGCRPGLLWRLTAADIDWTASTATLTSKSLPYTIYLPTPLLARLRELAKLRPTGPLFLNRHGRRWTAHRVRSSLVNVCRKLKMRVVTSYELRHETATRLLEVYPPAVVAALLNHKDLSMLSNFYNHTAQKKPMLTDAANASAKALVSVEPEPSASRSRRAPKPAADSSRRQPAPGASVEPSKSQPARPSRPRKPRRRPDGT